MLVNFNDESCSYDEHGNITNYRNQTCKFDKFHKLEQIGENSFTYDAFSCRTRINKIYYIYDGQGNLCKEEGEHEIFYHYEGDKVHSIQVDGNDYLLRRNLFGDVTHIYDTSGNLCAMYRYDAWGNHKVYDELGNENIDIDFIGNINPIRYRGYYFDKETALFYCNYRYYDPEVGRWISSDSIDYLNLESINGLNLYAYCENNPVNMVDSSGHASEWLQTAGWIGLGVGLLICGIAIGILTAGVGTATFLGAVAVGAAKGALIGSAIGVSAGAIAGGTGAMIAGEEFGSFEFWSNVLFGGMLGFGVGAVIGAISGGVHGANGWYNAKALEFTNSGLSEVFLGKDPTYFEIAQQNGGTSFHVSNEVWNSTASMKGVNMWKINKSFLKQQIALGNKFVFTSYNITGMYAKEVAYVLKYGIWAFLV